MRQKWRCSKFFIFHNRVQKTKSFILGSDYQGGRQMSSCSKFIKDEYHLVILFLERVRLLISLLPRRLVVTAFSPSATPATLLVLLWCSWRSVVLWARYIGDHFMTMTIQKPVQSKWRLLLLAMMNSQLSVIWIPILVTLVHGQGINLNPDEGSPCFVRDKDGIDDLSQPQVS